MRFGSANGVACTSETVDELGADSAGNVVVIGHVEVGTDDEGAEDRAQYIVKLDASGEELWRIETPDRREIDIPQNLAVSANGHAFVAASVGNDNIDASVTHYDADGNVVWTSTWGDEAAGDGVYDVALDSQANVFVAGDVWKDELSHAVVTKLDAQGNVVWTQQFDSVQDENASEVAVDSSGNVLLALRLGYKVGAIDSVVRKLDGAGNIVWDQTWEGPEDTHIFGLATDWHGNVFIAGSQEDDVESGFVAKLDCQGTVSWFERSSSWGLNVVTSLAVAPGGVVAASMGWSSGSIALTRLDTSGTLLWSDTFGTPETDRVYSLAVTTEQIVLAGETYGALDGINAGNSDSYVLALNPAH